jgi:5'-3' exonuclease
MTLTYSPIEGTLALIDGDILVYRIGFTTQDVNERIALSRVNAYIDEILFNSHASDYMIYLTGSNNYRKTLYPEYKANRIQEKPLHYNLIKQYLIDYEAAILEEYQDADDALGIAQTAGNDTTIICSIDKDLHQIPGRHYNFVKNEHTFVTPEEGIYFFYQQLLTGDRVDNIPGVCQEIVDHKVRQIKGLPKVGPVKAKKILGEMSDEATYKEKALAAYMEYLKLSEQEARDKINLIGKLLYIRKQPDEMWEF